MKTMKNTLLADSTSRGVASKNKEDRPKILERRESDSERRGVWSTTSGSQILQSEKVHHRSNSRSSVKQPVPFMPGYTNQAQMIYPYPHPQAFQLYGQMPRMQIPPTFRIKPSSSDEKVSDEGDLKEDPRQESD